MTQYRTAAELATTAKKARRKVGRNPGTKRQAKGKGDFRSDLEQQGWLGETYVEQHINTLLGGKDYEVKTDFGFEQSGNVAIEYMFRGKVSGISTSDADMWAILLRTDRVILIPTKTLQAICRNLWHERERVPAGDDKESTVILLRAEDFFSA